MPRPLGDTRMRGGEYFYGIDLIRFACAAGVGIYHLTLRMPEIAWSGCLGWVGVEVFFVISGLVIANSAHGATMRQFMVGRFMRIYPTAWCALVLSYPFFLWNLQSRVRPVLSFFLSVIILHGPFVANAYWTLPIEIAFYFLILLVIRLNGFAHIQAVSIALILWSGPYLVLLLLYTQEIIHWSWIDLGYGAGNLLLIRYGCFFGLGILIWLFKEGRIGKAGVCAAGGAILLAVVEIYARGVQYSSGSERSGYAMRAIWSNQSVLANFAFAMGLAAILLSVKFNHLFPANLKLRWIVRQLGLMTFPFYLLHENVGGFVSSQLGSRGVGQVTRVSTGLICTAGVSLLITTYLEPALRGFLKRHIVLLRTPQPRLS